MDKNYSEKQNIKFPDTHNLEFINANKTELEIPKDNHPGKPLCKNAQLEEVYQPRQTSRFQRKSITHARKIVDINEVQKEFK